MMAYLITPKYAEFYELMDRIKTAPGNHPVAPPEWLTQQGFLAGPAKLEALRPLEQYHYEVRYTGKEM